MDSIREKDVRGSGCTTEHLFDAKSGKIRISLKTFWKSLSRNPKKKGNNQLEIIYNFVKKYMKM